jgi:hypothetical protein
MCDHRRVGAAPDAEAASSVDLETVAPLGESRWPPALALVAFMAINVALRVWLPHEGAIRAPWGLLLVLRLAGPANAAGRRSLRPLA